MEILAGNLKKFFKKTALKAELTYKGDIYEVWDVEEETFQRMCDMSEIEFVALAGNNAWWRSCTGSVLDKSDRTTLEVNGVELICFHNADKDEYCNGVYKDLSEYLCEYLGLSQPKNVCAVAVDLAEMNGMSMGELFSRYEG